MCLAVSGEILAITEHQPLGSAAGASGVAGAPSLPLAAADPLWRVAEVDFGGVRQQVSLACLPQARVGDRVLVHVGFALSVIEADEALAWTR
jgi:hydrogenase expression/formation protein HypC